MEGRSGSLATFCYFFLGWVNVPRAWAFFFIYRKQTIINLYRQIGSSRAICKHHTTLSVKVRTACISICSTNVSYISGVSGIYKYYVMIADLSLATDGNTHGSLRIAVLCCAVPTYRPIPSHRSSGYLRRFSWAALHSGGGS